MMALFSLKNVIDSGIDFEKAALQSILQIVSLSYHNVMMHVEMLSKQGEDSTDFKSPRADSTTTQQVDAFLAGPSSLAQHQAPAAGTSWVTPTGVSLRLLNPYVIFAKLIASQAGIRASIMNAPRDAAFLVAKEEGPGFGIRDASGEIQSENATTKLMVLNAKLALEHAQKTLGDFPNQTQRAAIIKIVNFVGMPLSTQMYVNKSFEAMFFSAVDAADIGELNILNILLKIIHPMEYCALTPTPPHCNVHC